MCLDRGIVNESYTLISELNIDNSRSFRENLDELGMHDYVLPDELIVSSKRKNIIIISLESFERAYLSDEFAHLTPYLRSLISNKGWNYYDLNQNEGSTWTSGSIYTSLTGFPAYFGTQHNNIFQTSYHSDITGINHILKKVGCKMTYLVTDANFSGIQDMLFALEINRILDKTLLKDKIQDKDLFERAKHEAFVNQEKGEPFALYISTLSTHNPNGIYDKRMEKFVPPQKTNIEFMVSAVDYMLRDFINYLEEIDLLSNTVIYIFPDHLKHGDSRMFKSSGERGLFLLTNAPSNNISYSKRDTIYQIDLPNIILEGAEINHNAKFLTDYITDDKNEYIQENINALTALNISGFSRKHLHPYIIPEISDSYELYKNDTNRYIAHAGGIIDGKIYTNSLEALNRSYDKGFRLFELDIHKTVDNKYVAVHDWSEWKEITNYNGSTPVSHQEFLKHKIYGKYTPLDMDAINSWFRNHKDAILVTDRINEPKQFSERFIDKERLMMELFSWEAVKEGIEAKIKSAIPSQRVIETLGENKIEILKQHNIRDLSISRTAIASNMDLLKELKENNFRVYVYHVNKEINRDENYVVKHEMDFVYGIYADKWNFENEK